MPVLTNLPESATFTRGAKLPSNWAADAASNYSFSGADIVASVNMPGAGSLVIGELQTISYSIHRESRQVRTCGRPGPRYIVRGPRTIAGSLIFTVFDRHFVDKFRSYLYGEEVRLEYQGLGTTGMGTSSINIPRLLTDELPPFDITIMLANEYNRTSIIRIYGIHIVDEGQTMSIEDLITENTMTYMATDIDLMTPEFDQPGTRARQSREAALRDGTLLHSALNSQLVNAYNTTIGGVR